MGFTVDLLTGWAEALHAASVGTYRGDGTPYEAAETAIVLGDLPPTPDRVIGLRAYQVAHTGGADQVYAVQVRTRGARGDSTDVDDLADAVYDLMHYAEPGTLGAVPVALVWRESGPAPIGADDNRRSERTDTYYQHVTRTSPNLHP